MCLTELTSTPQVVLRSYVAASGPAPPTPKRSAHANEVQSGAQRNPTRSHWWHGYFSERGPRMKRLFRGIFLCLAGFIALGPQALAQELHFSLDSKFLTPPTGMATVGDSHGDIAVSPLGEIYVSVQGGDHAGIQVYSANVRYLRNVPGAPTDLHGFIITRGQDGKPY